MPDIKRTDWRYWHKTHHYRMSARFLSKNFAALANKIRAIESFISIHEMELCNTEDPRYRSTINSHLVSLRRRLKNLKSQQSRYQEVKQK